MHCTLCGFKADSHLHGFDLMLAPISHTSLPPLPLPLPHPHMHIMMLLFVLAVQAPAGHPSDVPARLLRAALARCDMAAAANS